MVFMPGANTAVSDRCRSKTVGARSDDQRTYLGLLILLLRLRHLMTRASTSISSTRACKTVTFFWRRRIRACKAMLPRREFVATW